MIGIDIGDLISKLTPSAAGTLKAAVYSHSAEGADVATLRPPVDEFEEARLKREVAYRRDKQMLTTKWGGI